MDATLSLPTILLDVSDNSFESLRCPCGSWSRLALDPVRLLVDGISIVGPVPTLNCEACKKLRLPIRAKLMMQQMARDGKQQGATQGRVNVMGGSAANVRFSLCSSVTLKYDSLDYFYIPGLERPDDSEFLTPVFFSIEILPYFQAHPGYVVNFASDTYGTIYTKDGGYISFGLTRAKHLIMWLGDLDALSQRDLQMLAAHNINSDHDIGSEFYEGQIEAIFSEISQEQRLIREQGRFAALLVKDFCGLRFLKMEKEAVDLMSNLRRPIYFTDDEFGSAMETMTKLLIERIDAVGLRADLLPHLSAEEVKATSGFRELRWLQLWLQKRRPIAEPQVVMLPLFVLYDLRVAYKHLLPESRKEELRNSAVSRLGLPVNTNLEDIYKALTSSIEASFKSMTAG
jgi:hypothetical protein